ncbi:MAG: hypothetical protein K2R98_31720 [Gemmataceae bacterium]|nr:hypothetical protein [Gemmataceae bacterium]
MPLKHLLCAARRLQAAWQAPAIQAAREAERALDYLHGCHQGLNRAGRVATKPVEHQLSGVVPALRRDVLARVRALERAAHHARHCLEQPPVAAPDATALLAELRQLQDEFGNLEVNLRTQTITVTTEAITLEDVSLGPFAVHFSWCHLDLTEPIQSFEVLALEPHPASTNDQVTHPHVRNGKLCPGDATAPLRKAVEQGRLADAFCLIRSVLSHYNSASPHVALSAWESEECHDCGRGMRLEEQCYCSECDYEFCTDCTGVCATCDADRCHGCLTLCSLCGLRLCGRCCRTSAFSGRECCAKCLRTCGSCGARVASDELDAERQRCPLCPEAEAIVMGPLVPAITDTLPI